MLVKDIAEIHQSTVKRINELINRNKMRFKEGIDIGSAKGREMTMPAELEILISAEVSEVRLTIQEGKFHQVKRMFHALGKEVIYLRRERMGSIVLDRSLKPGEYRSLTEEELKGLL